MKNLAILSLAVAAATLAPPAQAVTFNLDGAAATFASNSASTAGLGTVGGAVNNTAAPAGFSNFFTSDYGRLGVADAGAIDSVFNRGAGSGSGTYSGLVFTAADVAGTIAVNFDYAFVTTGSILDELSVQFIDPNLGSSITVGTIFGPATSFGSISLVLPGGQLTAGVIYNLVFTLTENTGDGNSAAGFDNIRIDNAPEPFTVAGLFLAAGAALAGKRKRQAV